MKRALAAAVVVAGLFTAAHGPAGPRPCEVQVTPVPTSPPPRTLAELDKGQAFELATGGLWIVARPAPPREPLSRIAEPPPVPRAGSRPAGWPEVVPPPAGWVYVVDVS